MPKVRLDTTFKRRLADKSPAAQAAVLECVERLADNPRHPGLRTHGIRTKPGVFSARVDRGNRVSFHWEGGVVVLRNHCNHDMVYKNP